MMSILLKNLKTKKEVDEAIRTTEDKVVALRFGNASEVNCLRLDHILEKCADYLAKMAVIYTVEMVDVPIYVQYFDITLTPSTVFFFNGQHIKVDYGTADHTKFIGCFREKQDLLDLIEVIYRGAIRGKTMVRSPIDYWKLDKYELLYKNI